MDNCPLASMLEFLVCHSGNVITIKVFHDFFQRYVAGLDVEEVDYNEFETEEAAIKDVISPADIVKCL